MPRLTQSGYQVIHENLFQLWRHNADDFQVLSATEQWHLHTFFAPDIAMTEADLAAYRKAITQQHPSLPQRAGKAFNRLLHELDAAEARREAFEASRTANGRRKKASNRHRQLRVQGVVHVVPDQAKLARAILQVAKDIRRAKEVDCTEDHVA